jgi:NAD(P)-dependent dehydrogenase (short-subunit alcohol dehydrogenase family)
MEHSQVVIVTGGTYGIGRAITLELARKGWNVVAFGLDERQLGSVAERGREETLAELEKAGLSAHVLTADVTKTDDVKRVVDFTISTYGRIDGLVNNAAIRPRGTILEATEADWESVMAVNLKGVFLCTRAVLPQMIDQGGGAVVNIGSGAGWGKPDLLAYSTSKAGIFAFSSALAYDHLRDHIRVNVVVPGRTESGMTLDSPGMRVLLSQATTAAGRPCRPQDIANAVAFLLSGEAEVISGAILDVGCFSHQGGSAPTTKNSVSH